MKKTAVIMQPTYLPWLGYFDLMDQADVFVFLDTVQFEKRSWQQRNIIKTPHGKSFITIPVKIKGNRFQKISQVLIDITQEFEKDHLKSVRFHYGKAPYFNDYYTEFESIFQKKMVKLADLNINLITWFKNKLGINCDFIYGSDLQSNGVKTELLISICKKVGATEYLSPYGSKEYIRDDLLFQKNKLSLRFHNYMHPKYKQLFGEFVPYLSVLDLLFNEGRNSLAIIRSGRR